METLISDLKNLLDNHLSLLEDLFLNYQDHSKPKNVKVAVRTGDWKGVLYYLQRYEYQKFIKIQAYYGACQLGCVELMKRFEIDEITKSKGLKYLAKRGHYQLINQYSSKIQLQFNYRILEGIVVSGDMEKIREFILNNPDLYGYHLSDVYYKIGKHNLGLDLINMLKEFIPFEYCIGQLKRILGISRENLFLMFKYNKIEAIYIYNFLTKDGNDFKDLYDGMIHTLGMKYDIVKNWAILLVFLGKFDRMEDTTRVIQENFDDSAALICSVIKDIVCAAVRIDNLDLFIKYYQPEHIKTAMAIAIDYNSIKILQYLFNNHVVSELNFFPDGINQLSDPRIVRMLVEYLNKYNTPLIGLGRMHSCAVAHGCDVVADILINI